MSDEVLNLAQELERLARKSGGGVAGEILDLEAQSALELIAYHTAGELGEEKVRFRLQAEGTPVCEVEDYELRAGRLRLLEERRREHLIALSLERQFPSLNSKLEEMYANRKTRLTPVPQARGWVTEDVGFFIPDK